MRLRKRRIQMAALILLGAVSLVFAARLAGEVTTKLDELRTARADNMIWTTTQFEVEFLEFHSVLLSRIDPGTPDLNEIRKRFDILYSRLDTLANSLGPRASMAWTGEWETFQRVSEDIRNMVPVIDGEDEQIRRALPAWIAVTEELKPLVRRIATRTNTRQASLSEVARSEMAQVLLRLAVASVALLISLLGLILLFWRLYQINRMRAIENLRTSTRLSLIVETSPDAVIVTDAEGVIRDCNSAATALLCRQISEVIGHPIGRFVVSATPEHKAFVPDIERDQVMRSTMLVQCPKGLGVNVDLAVGVARQGRHHIAVCFLRDITSRLEARAALEASRDQAMAGERAKSRFMAVMSHEMRTPLNGILGMIDLLRASPHTEEKQVFLDLMKTSADVLLGHVNDVLFLTQSEAGNRAVVAKPFDLGKLLADTVASLEPAARKRGNQLVLHQSPGPLGLVEGDIGMVRQVLLNLLANAVKFTKGGVVRLDVTRHPPDATGRDITEFQISDTGLGIAQENLSRVFDDFVRLDTAIESGVEGTGLGLGIARRLVETMGGEISAESEEGQGSLFWFRLALPKVEGQAKGERTGEQNAPRATLDILLVEDNQTNRFLLKEMMGRDGHRVTEAGNGQLGVDAASAQRFDLVIMDISMPVMDGFQACAEIRQGGGPSAKSRIMALTAHMVDDLQDRFDAAGFDIVLTKPLSWTALRSVIAGDVLAISQPRDDHRKDVSHTVLDELKQAVGADKFHGLLADFAAEGGALVRHLSDTDFSDETRAQVSHKLAGLAATFGAPRLYACATAVNSYGDSMATRPDDLRSVWEATVKAIERYAEVSPDL